MIRKRDCIIYKVGTITHRKDELLVHNANCFENAYKAYNALTKIVNKLNSTITREANNLINQFLGGNKNPGIGSKYLSNGIYYLRGRNGARVFYKMVNDTMKILGIADKNTEQQVINLIKKFFG